MADQTDRHSISARRFVVGILIAWQILLTLFLTLAGFEDRKVWALAGTLWGVNLLWIMGFGCLSVWCREHVAVYGGHSRKWFSASRTRAEARA
jgi:hypothetical protein